MQICLLLYSLITILVSCLNARNQVLGSAHYMHSGMSFTLKQVSWAIRFCTFTLT